MEGSAVQVRSYRELVRSLDLGYCDGAHCPADHEVGDAYGGVVHFADRRASWPGIHRVLKLAAQAKDPSVLGEAPWKRVYLLNVRARELGHQVGIRVPARFTRFDRAFVRAGVAGLTNDVPLRKSAFDWARRR
jgi:hypothetical protein